MRSINKTTVLLADDHVILLECLRELLSTNFDVVDTATDGYALITKALDLCPDVIVMDIYMPELGGFEACERLLVGVPGAKIVFLTVDEDPASAKEALRRGGLGYVLTKDAADDLRKAIEYAAQGHSFVSTAIRGQQIPPPSAEQWQRSGSAIQTLPERWS